MHRRGMACAAGVALLGGALALRGGGLWLYEHGTPDNMTAVAGRAASALDASTAVGNPAGMTQLEKPELLLGLQPMYFDSEFDPNGKTNIAGNDGGQAGGILPGGGFYLVYPVTSRLRLGMSNTSVYGAAMDFGDHFVGRYTVENVSLLTATIGPSIGYRVNDWLSVGAGAYLTYAALDQDIAVPKLEGGGDGYGSKASDGVANLEDETFGYSGSLGVLFHPRKGTRFGVTYATPVKLEFEDVLSAHGLGPGEEWFLGRLGLAGGRMNMEMVLPQGVMASVHQDLNECWAVMANLGWQDMSEAGQTDIDFDGTGRAKDQTLDRQFKDTYHTALGARCHLNQKWTWGLGVAYDTSPVDDDDRTIDMPLDRQIRYATGLQYALTENRTLGLAYTLIDMGDASVDQTYHSGARMAGDFSSDYLHIVTLTLGVKF